MLGRPSVCVLSNNDGDLFVQKVTFLPLLAIRFYLESGLQLIVRRLSPIILIIIIILVHPNSEIMSEVQNMFSLMPLRHSSRGIY